MIKQFSLLPLFAACVLLISCDTKTKTVDSCGDSFVDPGEECDGSVPVATTCELFGFYVQNGDITCSPECTFDLSVCTSRCGDGIIQAQFDEDCDGDNLAGVTCISMQLGPGELACNSSCRWDTSGCENNAVCGDGTVAYPYEACEPDDLRGDTCESLGYYGGELACADDCLSLDETACEAEGRCGDGLIQDAYLEECDGVELAGQTCETLGFGSGTLACDACRFDDSGCSMDRFSPNVGTLKYVPGGTLQWDATASNLSTVSAFRIGQHEITRAQFQTVMGTDPSNTTVSLGSSDPVQMVSWYHAIAFCNKLSLVEGLTPVYSVNQVDFSALTWAQIPAAGDAAWNAATADWGADGYRLPTEMEWMWAAMGADAGNPGATNTTGYLKAFSGDNGGSIDDYAWTTAFNDWKTAPVGGKLANELGLYDMSGNVWEWCWDWYAASYAAAPLTDYTGPASGNDRSRRGGGWSDSVSNYAPAARQF